MGYDLETMMILILRMLSSIESDSRVKDGYLIGNIVMIKEVVMQLLASYRKFAKKETEQ